MERKKYISPEMEIMVLSVMDIVRTSSFDSGIERGEDELPIMPMFF